MRKYLLAAVVALGVATTAGAAPITYIALLSGAEENPPNASTGTGFATVIIDTAAHTLMIDVEFSDLLGLTTASHIHCCAAAPNNAGVATQTPSFSGFPLGVTDGTYFHVFDLTDPASFRAGFITANGGTAASAEAALAAGLAAGQAYFNIHSTVFPGGEIRGFLAVPEPASLALLGLGLAGAAIRRRRRA